MTTNPSFSQNNKFELNKKNVKFSNDTQSLNNSDDVEKNPKRTQSEQQLIELINMHKKEKWTHTLSQVVIPFLIAGFGMVAAGVVFDIVQDWDLFQNCKEIIVLVPALLGLKGNLEMTLASRLSTQVNLQLIHNKETIIKAVLGNFALTQLQSVVVGFLASFVACFTEFILEQHFTPANLLTLIGSSIATASFASLILGGIIMFIIIISNKFHINPDNVATPIAASLGDLVTLVILAYFGTFFYNFRNQYYIHIIFIVVFLLIIPFLGYYCNKNEFVKETLYQGWVPVIIAMFISSTAGITLELAIKIYSSIAIYQPVVNGVGGNLVGIFASRLSTSLHKTSHIGQWAHWAPKKCISYPFQTFFEMNNPEHKTALILQGLALPGHIIFFFTLFYIQAMTSNIKLSAWMVVFYLIFTFLQVLILMTLCYYFVHLIWRLKKNPDNICLPILTALGDFLGVGFMFLCFHLVYLTGNESVRVQTLTSTTSHFNLTTDTFMNVTISSLF